MKTVSLSGASRAHVGKKDAKRLRGEGKVPCVIYGGDQQKHISIDIKDTKQVIYTPDVYQITLDVEGDKYQVIIQEMQFHPVTDEVMHIDFLQLFEDKKVKINLPIHLTGNALGVRNGGRLSRPRRRLACKGLPADFPDDILVDITELRIGQSIRVKDLSFPGIEFLHDDNSVVVGIRTARGAVEDEEEEEEGEGEEGEEGAEASEGSESSEEEKSE